MTDNLRSALLMVVAMSAFAIADTIIRMASLAENGATPGQILILHGVFGAAAFSMMLGRAFAHQLLNATKSGHIQARIVFDCIAAASMITALTLMSVGDVSAILQVQPLVVTVGAAIFLREYVGPMRWTAIAIGLLGVLVILRPGSSTFEPAAVLVLITVAGLAGRDLTTRAIPAKHPTAAISGAVSVALIPLGFLVHFALDSDRGLADIGSTALMLAIASTVFGIAGYYCLTAALRIGEISFVAPFRYSRLVAAFIFAWLLLGEVPDSYTLLGGAIVVASGLFVFMREQHLARQLSKT